MQIQTRQYRENATVEVQKQMDKFTHYYDRYNNHLLGIKVKFHLLHGCINYMYVRLNVKF